MYFFDRFPFVFRCDNSNGFCYHEEIKFEYSLFNINDNLFLLIGLLLPFYASNVYTKIKPFLVDFYDIFEQLKCTWIYLDNY